MSSAKPEIFLLQGVNENQGKVVIEEITYNGLSVEFLDPKDLGEEWGSVVMYNPKEDEVVKDMEVLEEYYKLSPKKGFLSGLIDSRIKTNKKELTSVFKRKDGILKVVKSLNLYYTALNEYKKSLKGSYKKTISMINQINFDIAQINDNAVDVTDVKSNSFKRVKELALTKESLESTLPFRKKIILEESIKDLQDFNISPDKIDEQVKKDIDILHGVLQIESFKFVKKLFKLSNNSKTYFLFVSVSQQDKEKLETLLKQNSISYEPTDWSKDIVEWKHNGGLQAFRDIAAGGGIKTSKEFDPTVLTSIFFMLFFAFCLGDGLYALMIGGFTGYYLFFKKLKSGVKSMFNLMFYSSLATLIFGILTNSWGGNLLMFFPEMSKFMEELSIINLGLDSSSTYQPFINTILPIDGALSNPVVFMLLVSGGIGLLHILIAFYLKVLNAYKAGNTAEAKSDLSWALFVTFLISSLLVDASLQIYTLSLAFISWISIIILSNAKTLLGKVASGLLSLYSLVSVGADAVSYTRIIVNGLASSIIAIVVNTLAADLVLSGSVLPVFFGLIILFVGHAFNILISTFAAYINPMRLHYVEFMPKFYQGNAILHKNYNDNLKYISL